MAKRGCGSRKAGAAYLCTRVGSTGIPLEWFLFDPILKVKPPQMSAQGLTPFEWKGNWHVMDWIGECYYPYPVDYYEEGARMGFSGRVEKNFDFGLLTPGVSTIWCWHPKAALRNPGEFYAQRGRLYCPNSDEKVRLQHLSFDEGENEITCAGLLWEVIDPKNGQIVEGRLIKREIPAGFYMAFMPPPGVAPQFTGGFFMRRPIHHIEVVIDGINGTHEETINTILRKNSNIEVKVCDE